MSAYLKGRCSPSVTQRRLDLLEILDKKNGVNPDGWMTLQEIMAFTNHNSSGVKNDLVDLVNEELISRMDMRTERGSLFYIYRSNGNAPAEVV